MTNQHQPVTATLSQEDFVGLLSRVRCATSTMGTLSEPGIVLLRVSEGRLTGHVQGRHLIATSWVSLSAPDKSSEASAAVNFQKLYQIVNSHDQGEEFNILFKDPAYLHLSSRIGSWKVVTTDLESYFQRDYSGEPYGSLNISNFNEMVRNAGFLSDTSKRTAIDSGIRLYHRDSTLSMFLSTGTEAAILSQKLPEPLRKDFDVFIKSWILKKMSLPGKGEVELSLSPDEDVLILKTNNTKVVISATTESSMSWEDATQKVEHKDPRDRAERVRINRIALRASLARLSEVSEGTVDLQVISGEVANLHSQLRAGDQGDEKITVFTEVTEEGLEEEEPTKVQLTLSFGLLDGITKIDTSQEDLEFEYNVDTKTALASVALFKGKVSNTPIDVHVAFPVGRD